MTQSVTTTTAAPGKVPGRSHYSLQYLRGGRVFSFAHQIDSVLAFEPRTVLEVGVGCGMVTAALRSVGVQVMTLDIQPELEPDLIGSVTDIPAPDASFDVVLCCQVLEHLPFDCFEPALREFRRVATRGVVMSLPDVTPYYYLSGRLPKLRRFHWTGTRRRPPPADWARRRWESDGHYWEIGYADTPLNVITLSFHCTGWTLKSSWRVPELPWHHFLTLRPTAP